MAEPDTRAYRAIVTRRGGSELLLSSDTAAGSLPSLEVCSRGRLAEHLVTATQQSSGLETYCLWFTQRAKSDGNSLSRDLAVMEVLKQHEPAPTGMRWASARELALRAGGVDRAAIRSFVEELDGYRTNRSVAPFAQPAWIEELFDWAREQLQPLGLHLTGGIWQLNASPTFSLIRLQTNRVPVWFKATGEPKAQERPISIALARLLPEYVPRILGVHRSWNGWLSPHVPGRLLSETRDRLAWQIAARELARLQIASIQPAGGLRDSGVRDLRTAKLARFIEPFIDFASELMETQEKASPAPVTTAELAFVRDRLTRACERLESLGPPDCLGRLDLSPGNIVISGGRAVFLDWAETYWGNPFLSFAYLLEHSRQRHLGEDAEALLKSSYKEPWLAVSSPEKVSDALALAPLVGVFAYAVASRSSDSPERLAATGAASLVRAMTRRMHREARLLQQRPETCRC